MNPKHNAKALRQAAAELIARQRRDLCRDSILKFGQAYLPHYFTVPPSPLHEELDMWLVEASETRDARLAVAAPRVHAKSTLVSLACVLWSVCYNREPYVILVSDTAGQAELLLAAVKKELEDNPRLLADFPGVCEPPGSTPGPPRWRQDEIVTRNNIRITALGAGQKIRGRRHEEHRPSLIILDDVENEEGVRSADQRDKLRDWFTRAVLNAGDHRTNVVVVGTILHYNSVLANLVDPRKGVGWAGYKYQAIEAWSARPELWDRWERLYNSIDSCDGAAGPEAARAFFEARKAEMLEGARVLWREREGEDYYGLMKQRIILGRAAFDSEKQNEPINPEDRLFRESDFQFWDSDGTTEEQLLQSLRGHCRIIGACDPSLGKAGKGRDDSAIITLARNTSTGTLYVLDADIRRRLPDNLVEAILAYQTRRKCAVFGIESNQFQSLLAGELRRRGNAQGVYPRTKEINHTSDKLGRIQSLQPLVASGTIRFSRRHQTLLDQLRQFPKGNHDDGPDALEMAVSLATAGGASLHGSQLYLPIIGSDPVWPGPEWIPYHGPFSGWPMR